MQLPRDIFTEVSKHIPIRNQAQFRRVNRTLSNLPRYWDDCCQEPTNLEITNWLLAQSKLLSNPNTAPRSLLNKGRIKHGHAPPNNEFVFGLRTDPNNYENYIELLMDDTDGSMLIKRFTYHTYAGDTLENREDLVNFLNNYQVVYDSLRIGHLIMVQDIFSSRSSCTYPKNLNDECFIMFLAKHIYIPTGPENRMEWEHLKAFLQYFINDTKVSQLTSKFMQEFVTNGVPYDSSSPGYKYGVWNNRTYQMKDYHIDTTKLKNFVGSWILTLTPRDLNPG